MSVDRMSRSSAGGRWSALRGTLRASSMLLHILPEGEMDENAAFEPESDEARNTVEAAEMSFQLSFGTRLSMASLASSGRSASFSASNGRASMFVPRMST